MTEYVIRFLVGGVLVSAFAMLGDVLRPKSFAGLFGAAPSVALATLGIAIYQHGESYAATQTLSMMAGAVALAVYGVVVCQLLIRARMRALPATLLSLVVWLIAALGLWALAGGQARSEEGEMRMGALMAGQPRSSGGRRVQSASAAGQVWKHQVAYASQFLDRDNRAHHGQSKLNARLCSIGKLDHEEWDFPPKPK